MKTKIIKLAPGTREICERFTERLAESAAAWTDRRWNQILGLPPSPSKPKARVRHQGRVKLTLKSLRSEANAHTSAPR